MQTELLCISVLSYIGTQGKVGWPLKYLKPAPPHHTPSHRRFILLTVLRRWSRMLVLLAVALWLILRGNCFMSCLVLFCSCVFSVLLALRLPRFGKRELILIFFLRLFDLRLFSFVCFLFILASENGCGL